MRVYKSGVFALVAFTLGAMPARAQDAEAVEVTPYVALGSAGASPVGAAVTFPVTSTLRCSGGMWRIVMARAASTRWVHTPVSCCSAAHLPIDTVCRRGSGAVHAARFFPTTVLQSAPSRAWR